MDWTNPGIWWLVAAAVLAVAELLVPGVFLVFIALAAAITGVVALLFPDLGIAAEFLSFAAWAVVIVLIGRRWYRDYPIDSDAPPLNDVVARLIGEEVVVTHAIEHGSGRVRIADGEWPVHGPDAPVGATMRITGTQGGVLRVEPIDALPPE